MKRSENRILTTHTGSLPRPPELLEMLRDKQVGTGFDTALFAEKVRSAVADVVRKQAEVGIDVVSDGEYSKPNFIYVAERLSGIETRKPTAGFNLYEDFPGFMQWMAERRGDPLRAMIAGGLPECVGPLAWKDRSTLSADVDNLKQALATVDVAEAFLPAPSIGTFAQRIPNNYYPTYEAYVEGIAEVMGQEYRAITDAGFLVQIDSPEMGIDRSGPEFRDRPLSDFLERMELWVEALNHALQDIPEDRVRIHVCWGNLEGPHTTDVPLADIIDVVLKVRAGAFVLEAANPRHGHEWKLWKDVKLPDGKVIVPGVIDTTTNFVEHPELVADRILNYANVLGRDNVIAGTDCGFGTGAFMSLVYPPIVWAKLEALAKGARLASKQLWG